MRHLVIALHTSLVACVFLLCTGSTRADATASNEVKQQLLQELASATSEIEARKAESALWEYWFDQSPTQQIRTTLDAGRERIQSYDYEAAENYLNQVVEAAPDYAEGYNQRAFARFLRENYDESQTDLEKVLELEPNHFGALSGMYHILRIQNRTDAAFGFLRQAVTIHPWINERGALPEHLWPEAYRQLHETGQEI